ncbi:MAG: deoxyribose-phosphate aldolase [Candidatus Firestonebacteria bacterium]
MASVKYELGNYEFKLKEFFPDNIFEKITDIRVNNPQIILKEAESRKKRKTLTKDGKLTILAADHPARMVTKSGDEPIAMGNRQEYLGRVLRVITAGESVDGVMGTTDIIEDLFIVNYLVKKAGGPSFLDEKVILGSMNRGGLAGAIFEMDDTMTCWTVDSIRKLGLDGAKVMVRLEPGNYDSAKTLLYMANVVTELNKYEIPSFIEPLYVSKEGYKVVKTTNELVKVIGVASALGDSSRNTWLKIPYAENFETVAKATTCPILLLGGESKGDPTGTMMEFINGLKAGKNVRGALVGRNILYPGKDDPATVALAVNNIVHSGLSYDSAVEFLMKNRGKGIDVLAKYIK